MSLPNLCFSWILAPQDLACFQEPGLVTWFINKQNFCRDQKIQKDPRESWLRAVIPVPSLVPEVLGWILHGCLWGPLCVINELLAGRETANHVVQTHLSLTPHWHGCFGSSSESRTVQVVVRGRSLWGRMTQDVFACRLLGIKALLVALMFLTHITAFLTLDQRAKHSQGHQEVHHGNPKWFCATLESKFCFLFNIPKSSQNEFFRQLYHEQCSLRHRLCQCRKTYRMMTQSLPSHGSQFEVMWTAQQQRLNSGMLGNNEVRPYGLERVGETTCSASLHVSCSVYVPIL